MKDPRSQIPDTATSRTATIHRAVSHTLYRKGTRVLANILTDRGYAKVSASVVRSYHYPTRKCPLCSVVHVVTDDGRSLKLTADRVSKAPPKKPPEPHTP